MNHRERGLACLGFRPTDRCACDYSAHGEVTRALIARLGVSDEDALLEAFGVDFRHFGWGGGGWSDPDPKGWRRDLWGVRLRTEPPTGWDVAERAYPFHETDTPADVERYPWPRPEDVPIDRVGLRQRMAAARERYVVVGVPWCPFFHEVGRVMPQEEYFMAMFTNPALVHAVTERIVGYFIALTRRYLDAVGDLADVVAYGNDFGTQRGLFIGPEQWNTFVRPYLKRFYDLAHAYDLRAFQHSCGAVRELIPALIQDGLNILDPIQTASTDMKLDGLLRDFGGQLVFHGGVDTQEVLPFGSADDVRRIVRDYRNWSRRSSGYILASSQAYLKDIPLDNIMAVYEENRAIG